jgi:hypothetical protein
MAEIHTVPNILNSVDILKVIVQRSIEVQQFVAAAV